jgi:hypothetical protein
MFVSTTAGGMCMAFPDVCKTPSPPLPPIPIPYPNNGMCNQATNFSMKVKICMKESLTTKSKIPQSMGDEAGAAGGIVSGMIKGPVKYTKGSSKVKFEGQPVVHLTSMTAHNGSNANAPAGTQVAPSQTKVLVLA